MAWPDTYVGLLAVCGDAATSRTQKSAAVRLLATELIARLSLTNREHNPPLRRTGEEGTEDLAPVSLHFSYRDYQSPDPVGGDHVAQMYMRWGNGNGHHFPGAGTVPKTPRPQAEYDLTLIAIALQGEALITEVVGEMGSGPFEAAKEPYLDYLSTHFPETYPPDS